MEPLPLQDSVATVTPFGNGEYTLSWAPLNGVSGVVILPLGSLTDSYGYSFPSVQTVIGSFSAGAPAPNLSPLSTNPVANSAYRAANVPATPQTTQTPQSNNVTILAVLAILLAAGGFLLLKPRRTTTD